MPRINPKPDLATPHYTRVIGTGEAISGAVGGAFQGKPDAPTQSTSPFRGPIQSKEIAMLRICIMTAILALTTTLVATLAQAGTADSLAVRVHDAAVTACAPERATGTSPRSHYGAIEDHCVYRISREAMAKYDSLARSGATAKLAHN